MDESLKNTLPADVLSILRAREVGIAKIAEADSQPGSGGAWDEVEALAKVMVEKGDAPTNAQAIAKVLDDNPALYKGYRAEQ